MSDGKENIATFKQKLKFVTKIRIIKERDALKQRNNERVIIDELSSVKKENEMLSEKIEELVIKIAQTKNQISMIEICKKSEKVKCEAHINTLNSYGEDFQTFFDKERDLTMWRNTKSMEKKKEEEEKMQKQIAEQNQQRAQQISAIHSEYESVEQECAVLKKRNNAIMLKLRRKLLETENVRRELMKRCGDA